MFDPTLPIENTEIDAVQMRAQLTGLKALIDAIQNITAAQVDGVNTVGPGDPAAVNVSVIGTTLHFTFDIPAGIDGSEGQPGEVSTQQLDDAINGTSANTNAVSVLGFSVSDPPEQSEVQQILDKMDELILNGRR